MTKTQLRQIFLNKRQQLALNIQKKAAQAVAANLYNAPFFKKSRHIACYLAIKNELNTAPIIKTIWNNNKICYLPVLNHNKLSLDLCFARFCEGDRLVNNNYGIPEPVLKNNIVILPQDLDIVLLPLIAFDMHGNRLGWGKGCYDYTFAFKLHENTNDFPLLIGAAYDWQKTDKLVTSKWDVPLQAAITNTSLYKFKQI